MPPLPPVIRATRLPLVAAVEKEAGLQDGFGAIVSSGTSMGTIPSLPFGRAYKHNPVAGNKIG
ncbi:hypothetical protein SDC9_178440 [bioreactor metagenome]|uniref:Uncharacterized protein n=1 Tax=bioreactor metagenome TaxID=1076179 RepID=A0A645GZ13_9ZZZZ